MSEFDIKSTLDAHRHIELIVPSEISPGRSSSEYCDISQEGLTKCMGVHLGWRQLPVLGDTVQHLRNYEYVVRCDDEDTNPNDSILN